MQLHEFKNYCINLKPDILVQKYLIEDGTYFFDKIVIGEEFEFKKDIALSLNVHIRDIVIVGSGKFGFSLKPDFETPGLYLFKEFDYNNKKSDLDIAIVSSTLFDKEVKNLYTHTSYHKINWINRNSLAKYALKGKLATRFLPIDFPLTKEIAQVQENYQMKYGREINLEIYKSWYFFETYHQDNIKNIQIMTEEEIREEN